MQILKTFGIGMAAFLVMIVILATFPIWIPLVAIYRLGKYMQDES